MTILALLFCLASPTKAADFSFKKQVNTALLKQELFAAGIQYSKLTCRENDCVIANPSKDPAAVVKAHVYKDPFKVLNENRDTALQLFLKLRAGTATQAEKDELLEKLAFILVGQNQ